MGYGQHASVVYVLNLKISKKFYWIFLSRIKNLPIFMWTIKSIVDFRRNDHFKKLSLYIYFQSITVGVANKHKFKKSTIGVTW